MVRWAFASIIIMSFFTFGCAHQQQHHAAAGVSLSGLDRAKWAYMAGQLAEEQENFDRAADYYRQVLDIDPEATTVRRYLVQNLIRLSNFHEAAKEYRILAAKTPEDQKTKFILGQLHEASGNTEMAEVIYRDVVEMGEERSGPFTRLGILLLRRDKNKEGINVLEKSLKIDPRDRDARLALMQHYLSTARWKTAKAVLNDGLKYEPANLEWLAYLAQINEEHQVEEEAKDQYLKILRIYPDYPLAYRFLGMYYLKRQQWADAVPYLRKELEYTPENLLVKRNLGLALYENNELAEAGEILYDVAQDSEHDALTRLLLGSIYRKKKLYYLAEHEFKAAIKYNGSLKDAYFGLANIYLVKNDYEKALALLAIASVKFQDSAYVFLQYGMVLIKVKDYKYALKILEKGKALEPENPDILFHLGRAYYLMDNLETAALYWKRCIDVDDRFAEAYNYLGYSYAEKGRELSKAVKWLERAVLLDPGNGYYLDSLGWAYFKQKNYQRALKTILHARQALEHKGLPVDAVILEHLGDIYFKLKRFVEARQAWRQALEKSKSSEVLKNKLESIPAIGGKVIHDIAYP